MELLPQLTPVERAFFDKLDEELDKVESFYCEREREMRQRANLLKQQLQDLQDHRRAFYEAHPIAATPYSWLPLPLSAPIIPNILIRRRKNRQGKPSSLKGTKAWKPSSNGHGVDSAGINGLDAEIDTAEPEMPKSAVKQVESQNGEDDIVKDGESSPEGTVGRSRWRTSGAAKNVQALFQFHAPPVSAEGTSKGNGPSTVVEGDNGNSSDSSGKHGSGGVPAKYDPEEYQHAKKQLKKAVLECYRGLELLNNYRTLNLIGFRKALKKFEKVTHIPAQQAYTKEKIEPSAFSSGATVDALIREMEALFAARFARGDKKKALARLRGGTKHTSHHFSTFRTGMFIGLAIPALADGLYRSFRSDTRAAIPGWGGLLYIYSIFFVPTFFSLLVGTNLLVWARSRINYVFIFELDIRTRMDHRLPALLLCLLCYAFWLSFARVGANHISPTSWPLIWLAITAAILFNPLPIMFKSSRWWLIKNVSKLLTSGMHRVEFADFWMGDQFCSLVFTLSHLYYVGCVYAIGIDETWRYCTTNPGPRWGIAFLVGTLPLLVRLVQSVKRWVDSRLITHLINMVLTLSSGGQRGPMFVAWCVFGTCYSIYAGAWDLLMDWSLLKPHAPYPLLRPNLLYNNAIPFYYFAIVTNVLIRFIWVFYIPEDGPDFIIRTFIAGMLEALRRWQWNFLRLENEHLGNIDQYRVTREVPLPYSYDEPSHDSDNEDEDDDHRSTSSRSWRRPHRGSFSENAAAGADA
ncbi:hypothetical protein BN946_scf184583.g14 [Trametes cinnabarina]|uniref:SPX domain-containing protein n=1 Tax=Pycnoporus cinnabarinus TaxID=5643 RepID=A0A060SJA2_PYCCI|nr:hypothetical protein BN946_scf184583.g14 [Trametes cinnabarina]